MNEVEMKIYEELEHNEDMRRLFLLLLQFDKKERKSAIDVARTTLVYLKAKESQD